MRLVLIHAGVPEVDQTFARDGIASDALISEIRRSVSAWQILMNRSVPLGWWLSFPESHNQTFMPLIDAARQDCLLNQPFAWNPAPWGEDSGDDPLEPLEQLALFGMLVESH